MGLGLSLSHDIVVKQHGGSIEVDTTRPGKNFTGVTFLTNEMAAKRIELLKEVAPDTKRVAVIFNPQHLDDELTFARKAAQSLSIENNIASDQ